MDWLWLFVPVGFQFGTFFAVAVGVFMTLRGRSRWGFFAPCVAVVALVIWVTYAGVQGGGLPLMIALELVPSLTVIALATWCLGFLIQHGLGGVRRWVWPLAVIVLGVLVASIERGTAGLQRTWQELERSFEVGGEVASLVGLAALAVTILAALREAVNRRKTRAELSTRVDD